MALAESPLWSHNARAVAVARRVREAMRAERRAAWPATRGRRVRDARPQGRDTGAHARAPRDRREKGERRGLGAVGNSRIVAYGARSPARSAAEGHARNLPCSTIGYIRESHSTQDREPCAESLDTSVSSRSPRS